MANELSLTHFECTPKVSHPGMKNFLMYCHRRLAVQSLFCQLVSCASQLNTLNWCMLSLLRAVLVSSTLLAHCFSACLTSWQLVNSQHCNRNFRTMQRSANRSPSEARRSITLKDHWGSIERFEKLSGSLQFLKKGPTDTRFQSLTRGQPAEV